MAALEVRAARWVLPVSLAVNVFLATLVGVHVLQSQRPPPRPPHPHHLVDGLIQIVPPADGAILKEIVNRVQPDMDRLHQSRHRILDQIKALTAQPTVDEAALKALFADMRQTNEMQDARISGAILEAVQRLSPEARRKVAQWAPSRPPPPPDGFEGRRDHGGDGPPPSPR